MGISTNDRRTAFSIWMRTGRWPTEAARAVEVKFNPWHDPRDGRFTFAPGGPRQQDPSRPSPKLRFLKETPGLPTPTTMEQADAWRAEKLKKYGRWRQLAKEIEAQYQAYKKRIAPPQSPLDQAIEFYGGEVHYLYDLTKNSATSLYSLITKPGPTLRNSFFGLAGSIDALATDETPTYVYLQQAGNWLTTASPHDLGYSMMSGANTIGVVIAPETIGFRLSKASRFGKARSLASGELEPLQQVVANARAGRRRESLVFHRVKVQYPGATVQRQITLRTSNGKRAIDPLTGEGRRVDFAAIKDGHALDLIEATSMTSRKAAQIAKETRIRQNGGNFIKDRSSGHLIDIAQTPTRIVRKK